MVPVPYANNDGTYQPAHLCSLTRTFTGQYILQYQLIPFVCAEVQWDHVERGQFT